MSHVDDCAFIAMDRRDATRFTELVADLYDHYGTGWRVQPQESSGPKVAGGHVYYIGFNYAPGELLDALVREKWSATCVLWWWDEGNDVPLVRTWNVREPEVSR